MLAVIRLESPQVVELSPGDTLRVMVKFGYRGVARQVTLYVSIGSQGFFGFDEIISGQKPINLPDSPDNFTTRDESLDILITEAISPGTGYDLMAKIKEYPNETETKVFDVITIVGAPSPWVGLMAVMMIGMMASIISQVMPTEKS